MKVAKKKAPDVSKLKGNS